MLRKDFCSTGDITQFTSTFRIADALVISLAIAKMVQQVSLLVHLRQAVHSIPRLYHPSRAIVVEVLII